MVQFSGGNVGSLGPVPGVGGGNVGSSGPVPGVSDISGDPYATTKGPTGLTTPYLIQEIKAWTSGLATSFNRTSYGSGVPGFLQKAQQQLESSGYSASQAHSLLYSGPSEVQKILDQIAMSALFAPPSDLLGGEAGAAGAAGAAAGEGGAAGAGTSSALGSAATKAATTAAEAAGTAGVVSGIWTWLTTASHWVRILEFVGGAVLVYMAVKGLTGIDMPSATEVAGKIVK